MSALNTDCVAIFKALSDETRLEIVKLISKKELYACDILQSFKITQPTLSYHMKLLTECGVIGKKREGTWIKYNVNHNKFNLVKKFIDTLDRNH